MGKKLLNAKQIFTYSEINIRFVRSWKHLVHLPETQNFYLEVKEFFYGWPDHMYRVTSGTNS